MASTSHDCCTASVQTARKRNYEVSLPLPNCLVLLINVFLSLEGKGSAIIGGQHQEVTPREGTFQVEGTKDAHIASLQQSKMVCIVIYNFKCWRFI